MSDDIEIAKIDGIATITLNRPAVMNAMTPAMWESLLTAFQQIEHDHSVRCVLIKGAGDNFCSGQDVHEFAKLAHLSAPEIAVELKRAVDSTNPLLLTMERIAQPVIASVRGIVAGGGLSIVAACDLVVASDTAKFMVAQIKLGVIPDVSLAFNLRRAIGIRKAKQLCLLGETIDAKTAADLNLVNWVVPDGDLDQTTSGVIHRLVGLSATAVGGTKALLNRSFNRTLAEHAAEESLEVGKCVMEPDFMNNVRKFTERRRSNA